MRFYKYHGTGNDFILIDDRDLDACLSREDIAALCHRRFGIGADGLMLLQRATGYNFKMVYYNADGGESTMCGNGGRCMVMFAHALGLVSTHAVFTAIDGEHHATILPDNRVRLKMADVGNISDHDTYITLNTGSPHYVAFRSDVAAMDVVGEGREIRYSDEFKPGGTNVNFVERVGDVLFVRTYERGVEDETWSCGTGVTAAAIASTGGAVGHFSIGVRTLGGSLQVDFEKSAPHVATNIHLLGPAVLVFSGEVETT
jgi:diaminopimelate epimerase